MNATDGFMEIEQLAVLRRFQEILNVLTGLSFDFLDRQAIHAPSLQAARRPAPFCALINRTPHGRAACDACTCDLIQQGLKQEKIIIRPCHLGLIDVYIPVLIHHSVVGFFTTGQFLLHRPAATHFNRIKPRLAGIGIAAEKAKPFYFRLPVLSRGKLNAIINLIHLLIESIVADDQKMALTEQATQKDPVIQARRFMETHYMEPISLTEVAAAVHLSPSRLSHLFAEKSGRPLTSYLHDVRLFWAKYFLVNTSLRIIEIAAKTGFDNVSHFNHIFRKKEEQSPRQYRERHGRASV